MQSIFSHMNDATIPNDDKVNGVVDYLVELNTYNSHVQDVLKVAVFDLVEKFIIEPFKLSSRFRTNDEFEEHVYKRFFSILT
jgi:hypothetical protein